MRSRASEVSFDHKADPDVIGIGLYIFILRCDLQEGVITQNGSGSLHR